MSERRTAVMLIALLSMLLVIALVLRPRARAVDPRDTRVSTFLRGPNGGRALQLFMDELDIPSEQWLRPWSTVDPKGALVVLAPAQAATPRELAAIRAWLNAGGTLIFAAGGNDARLRGILRLRMLATMSDSLSALERVRWTGVAAYPTKHAWGAAVDSVTGFRQVFSRGSEALRDSADVILRTSAGEAVAVTYPFGNGRVIAFSDAAIFTNASLREGGAALLFARAAAVATEDDGKLHFDEFHQGFRPGGPVRAVRHFVAHTGAGRGAAQAAVACLALLLLTGSRLGSPVKVVRGRRRSPLEHVEAVAAAYRRAGAHRTTRRLLVAGLERRLGRRIIADEGELRLLSLDATPAGRRLKQEWEQGEKGDLVALAGAVDDFVGEVRRWK